MTNYAAAGRWSDHVRALALVESSERDNPPLSDDGLARGLLGLHPAFFYRWYGWFDNLFVPEVSDSWATADTKAVAAFLEAYVDDKGLDLTVMAFHLGETAVFEKGERDPGYLAKWGAALQTVRSHP